MAIKTKTAIARVKSDYEEKLGTEIAVSYLPFPLIDDMDDREGEFTVKVVETDESDLYREQCGFLDSLYKVEILASDDFDVPVGSFALIDGLSFELSD